MVQFGRSQGPGEGSSRKPITFQAPTLPPHGEARADALDERARALVREIHEGVIKALGPEAAPLTPFDLQTVILNGLCQESGYFIPAGPQPLDSLPSALQALCLAAGMPNGSLVVLKENNPYLYAHCLQTALLAGAFTADEAEEFLQNGIFVADERQYERYVDLLQRTSQLLCARREEFEAPCAELVALRSDKDLGAGRVPLGAFEPLLKVWGPHPQGLLLQPTFQADAMCQRLAKGSVIYVPGAGFNSLLHLGAMAAASDYSFVLGDKDPFVTKVLSQVASARELSNVKVVPGAMRDAASSLGRIDLVLVSNLFCVEPGEIKDFCSFLLSKAPVGTPIHVVQQDGTHPAARCTAGDWRRALSNSGFSSFTDTGLGLPSLSFKPAQRSALESASGAELVRMLRTKPSPEDLTRTPYASYLVFHTPVRH